MQTKQNRKRMLIGLCLAVTLLGGGWWGLGPTRAAAFALTTPRVTVDAQAGAVGSTERGGLHEAIARKLRTQAKVNVELFVMSQCPFGVRAEEALAPVLKEFGAQVELQLRFIAQPAGDGFASLHGQPEVDEDIRQTVMAAHFPQQYFAYVVARAANYRVAAWQPVAAAAGLEVATVERLARSETGKRLFAENIRRANELHIAASPTILLDGEKYSGSVLPPAPRVAAVSNGFNPHGTGSLSVLGTAPGGGRSIISGGWSIDITTATQTCTPGTVCRPSAGVCDVADICDPNGICPPDSFQSPSTVCRAVTGVCDLTENCTGSSADCPPDSFESPSTVCRAGTGVCDPAEVCTGSSALCPADVLCCTNPVVTNTADSGTGSLRQAIADVCPGGTITFAGSVVSPITLASELTINKSLTIQGPGAHLLTVSGNNAVRVFNITAGNFDVTLSGLTMADGRATDSFARGGGIRNESTGVVNITDCTLSGNVGTNGGGIYKTGTGTMNITNSTLSGNSAGEGGGINSRGTVNVTNSTLSGNSAGVEGGGIILHDGGTLTITNSTISGNFAGSSSFTAGGGGISTLGTVRGSRIAS